MSFKAVAKKIDDFDRAREWWYDLQAADLAKSIIIESAELLEHFQWDMGKVAQWKMLKKDEQAIADEVADIFIYLFKFCRQMWISPEDAILNKLEKTDKKYPVWYNKTSSYDEIKKAHRKGRA